MMHACNYVLKQSSKKISPKNISVNKKASVQVASGTSPTIPRRRVGFSVVLGVQVGLLSTSSFRHPPSRWPNRRQALIEY